MNPNDWFHFLTGLIRDDPGALAAFILGIAFGGFGCCWLFGRRTDGKDLQSELKELHREKESLGDDLQKVKGHAQDLTSRLAEARAERDTARLDKAALEKHVSGLQHQLGTRQAELAQWQKKVGLVQEEVKRSHGRIDKLEQAEQEAVARAEEAIHESQEAIAEKGKVECRLARVAKERDKLREVSRHIGGMMRQGGRVWEAPFAASALAFKPLSERRAPIISILNLKGGVGKTTISLNLGVALSNGGQERVLLVDLDHQRSLSTLCVPYEEVSRLHARKRCLQQFLAGPQRDAAKLLDCAVPLGKVPGCSAVVSSDAAGDEENLDEVESRLLSEWLVQPDAPDVRLHLRNALHAPEFNDRFDYVLLDCPPRLSVACMNALAASDFVLIPVLLDWTSAISAPRLLGALKRYRARNILPHIGVLGVVANRTTVRAGALVKQEQAVLNLVPKTCKDVWGAPVHFFNSTIRQSAVFASAVGKLPDSTASAIAVSQDADVADMFQKLVNEVKVRIKHESGRPATVSS